MIERKKIILGFAGITAAAVMGTGVTAAQTMGSPNSLPTSKADCANFQKFSFKDKPQCESWWDNQAHGNSGYGNTNANIETNLNVNVDGNNNIINIALNYVFGH